MDLHIDGTLTPIAPLHIATPGEHRVDPKTLRFSSSGTTCTRTEHLRMVRPNGAAGYEQLPVIPANSLRGQLRRAAADLIEMELKGKDEVLDLFTYNAIRSGLPHGNPDGKLPSVQEYRAADPHVFFGLFGGGPRLLPSYHHLITDTLLPVVPLTIEAGYVPESFREVAYTRSATHRNQGDHDGGDSEEAQPYGRELTQFLFFRRMDDTLQFADPHAEGVIANYMEAVDEWQNLVGRAATEEEKQEERPLAPIDGFNAMEVVIPGVPFRMSIEAPNVNEAQAGFLLKAVQQLHHVQWGGWNRNGFGRANLDLWIHDEDGNEIAPFTKLDGDVQLDTDQPFVARLNQAADDGLEALTAAELTEFMQLGDKSQEALDKGRKKMQEKQNGKGKGNQGGKA